MKEELNNDEDSFITKKNFFGDILSSLFAARFTAPIVAILGIVMAYQITIAPYIQETRVNKVTVLKKDRPIGLIRPYLSPEDMTYIQKVTMNAQTQFSMHSPESDIVNLRFYKAAPQHGTPPPPELFYEGVTFGLSEENPFSLEYTAQLSSMNKKLLSDLEGMNPSPTYVINRTANFNNSMWSETGYAVHFSYVDLEKQGKLSSDLLQPWKRVVEDILEIARKHKQIYITAWYPHSFGKRSLNEEKTFTDRRKLNDRSNEEDRTDLHRFDVILQQIIPTRTGLDGIKSTAAVWLSD